MNSKDELKMLQSLPLDVKIAKTNIRIREWVDRFGEEGVYVSFSGGKDSLVLLDLVKKEVPSVKVMFVNTGLEFDSVREKGIELADDVIRPEKSFVQIITEYGYPIISKEVAQSVGECQKARELGKEMPKYRTDKFYGLKMTDDGRKSPYNMEKYAFLLDAPFKISHLCCNNSKKNPSKKYEKQTGLKPFIGTTTEESRLRQQKWIKVGCNAFEEKRPTSQPMSFWTEQDILMYIKQNNLKMADIYGEIVYTDDDGMYYENNVFNNSMKLTTTGAKRTGCTFCLFGITREKDRLLILKEKEPKKYDYVMRGGKFDENGMWIPHNGLGYKFVIDWLNEHGNLGIKY